MANNNNKKKSNNNNNSSSGSKLPLNKISFFVIGAVAILYLLAGIFSAVDIGDIGKTLVGIFQTIANVMLIGIVGILGWRYVAKKQTVWKVLYIVFILVILVGIVLPLVF